jgi:hypothetical protein
MTALGILLFAALVALAVCALVIDHLRSEVARAERERLWLQRELSRERMTRPAAVPAAYRARPHLRVVV